MHLADRQDHASPHLPSRPGRRRRAAVPRRHGTRLPRSLARGTRAAAADRQDAARRASSRCTAPPAPTPGARRSTSGRRPASAATTSSIADSALAPLEPWRKYLTIVSNTDVRMAEAFEAPEIGGDHFRSSAVFLTQSHPKQTQGSDLSTSARRSTRSSRAASAGHGDSVDAAVHRESRSRPAAATTTTPARTPTRSAGRRPTEPLPMIRNPRVAFDLLFGAGANNADRAARRKANQSILDWIVGEMRRAQARAGRRRSPALDQYLGEHPRARAPHPGRRGAEHERRASARSRKRRSACPIRSRST